VGSIPFGYELDTDGVHLVENATEQRAIELVKQLRADGMSIRKIAEHMNNNRVDSRGNKWHPTTVARLLKKENLSISKLTSAALKEKRARGEFCGGRLAYGKRNDGGRIVPNPGTQARPFVKRLEQLARRAAAYETPSERLAAFAGCLDVEAENGGWAGANLEALQNLLFVVRPLSMVIASPEELVAHDPAMSEIIGRIRKNAEVS